MFSTTILRGGPINKINDTLPGGGGGNIGPQTGRAPGQLGAGFWLDDSNVFFDSSMGTVYGGHFRYVRLKSTSSAVVVGQIVFEDVTVADNLAQVTTLESGSTDGAMFRAGIVLNSGWTPGNYGVIQDAGLVFTQFRGTLTSAGAVGSRVFCAAVGAGVDNGFADVLSSANPTLFSDVSLMLGRYMGNAFDAPTSGGLKRIYLNMGIIRD